MRTGPPQHRSRVPTPRDCFHSHGGQSPIAGHKLWNWLQDRFTAEIVSCASITVPSRERERQCVSGLGTVCDVMNMGKFRLAYFASPSWL